MVIASMYGSFLFAGYGRGSSLNGPAGACATARPATADHPTAAAPARKRRRSSVGIEPSFALTNINITDQDGLFHARLGPPCVMINDTDSGRWIGLRIPGLLGSG